MPSCTVFSHTKVRVSKKAIERVVLFVFKKMKKKGTLSVHCVGEKKIRNLNKTYRGKDKVTDVLSFGVEDLGRGEEHDWGDLFLCQQKIIRQAKQFGVFFQEEFFRMLVHGSLHLFGYDHQTEKDAKKMFGIQEKILKNL